MFAQLGTIQFATAKSFSTFSERGSAKYAEHSLIDGKPRLQKTGNGLNEISVSILFHNSFCVPQTELNRLKEARDNGEILPLLWGDGTVEGDFIISDVEANKEQTTPEGTALSISVQLSLKEFVVPNKLQQEQADNRSKAKAVGNKKPVVKPKTNADTCPQTISGIVNKIFCHYSAVSSFVLGGTSGTTVGRAKILSHLSAMRLLNENLLKRCDDPESCASSTPDIKATSTQVQSEINNFNQVAANSQSANYPTREKALGAACRALKQASRTLINTAITRK
jgi:phage protein U